MRFTILVEWVEGDGTRNARIHAENVRLGRFLATAESQWRRQRQSDERDPPSFKSSKGRSLVALFFGGNDGK